MVALIVEDEPLAAGVLKSYIEQTPFLRLAGICPDAVQALDAMRQQAVDVLFLDLHLPGLKGLDFLKILPQRPQTILTTAYHEYALESYDYGVVDYLLKPIDFERFMMAVQKIRRPEPSRVEAPARAFHFFNCNKKMVRVWLDEVIAVESLKEYVRLYLADGTTLVTKSQLGAIESLLAPHHIVRVHRSFLAALPHVTAFTAAELSTPHLVVPVGRQFKDVVRGYLERMGK